MRVEPTAATILLVKPYSLIFSIDVTFQSELNFPTSHVFLKNTLSPLLPFLESFYGSTCASMLRSFCEGFCGFPECTVRCCTLTGSETSLGLRSRRPTFTGLFLHSSVGGRGGDLIYCLVATNNSTVM